MPGARGDFFFFPSLELAGNRKGPPRQELPGVPWAGPAVLRDFAFASASQVNARSEGAVRGSIEYLHFCVASHILPPFLRLQFLHGTGLISGHLIYPQVTPCPEGSASSPRTLLLIFLIPALSHPLSLPQPRSAPSPVPSSSLLPPTLPVPAGSKATGMCAEVAEGVARGTLCSHQVSFSAGFRLNFPSPRGNHRFVSGSSGFPACWGNKDFSRT